MDFTLKDPGVDASAQAQHALQGDDIRFDHDMLQRVVELANELQAKNRQTLSLSEAESIAREVGIEPCFVREAAARLLAVPAASPHVEMHAAVAGPQVRGDRKFNSREFFALTRVQVILFGLAGFVPGALFSDPSVTPSGPFWLLFFAACLGFCHKRRLNAVVNPAVFSAAGLLTMAMPRFEPVVLVIVATWAAAGGLAGLLGHGLRYWQIKPRQQTAASVVGIKTGNREANLP